MAQTFQPDALTKALNSMNIASGLVLDESELLSAKRDNLSILANGNIQLQLIIEIIPLTNNRVNVIFILTKVVFQE